MQRMTELRNQILKAKHAYYHRGEAIMSDAEYDAMEDELRLLSPDDPVLAMVGAPVAADSILTKARHAMPMGSQSKVNSEDEFRAWFVKNDVGALHASLKGDGASAAAYYTDGRLVQTISRGDGMVGEDITANALHFKGLPAWVGSDRGGFSGSVRFEVILTVADWSKIDPARSKNPRNAGTGIMGRKNGHQSDCLTIFAFDLDETVDGRSVEFGTESDKSERLINLGFNVIPHVHCQSADEAIDYFQSIAKTRDTLPIWIDGVVLKMDDIAKQIALGVTAGRPKGQIAWKFDSSGVETVLEGVVVSGGHTGGLYPTAQLRPVEIGGTTVSNASLANYDEIARLDVAIGDSVWVVKANDIIPKIIRVTQRPSHRNPIPVPVVCPFCGGEVGRRIITGGDEGVILECRSPACPKKSTGKIRRWIASLDILGIGDVVLEAMVDQLDLQDAADLYLLNGRVLELADLNTHAERELKLGAKRAKSILDAIDATRTLTLSRFIGSLGTEHLGKRRVELMIRAAQGDLDTLDDWRCGKLRDPVFGARAGVPSIGSQIQDGIDEMASVIDRLLSAGVTIEQSTQEQQSAAAEPLKTICISGKLLSGKKKGDYEDPLKAVGYALVDDVVKGLNYLVLAEPDSTSSKAVKARKLGIPVISEDDLLQIVSQAAVVQPEEPKVEVNISNSPRQEIEVVTKSAQTGVNDQLRHFEYVDEKSSKFWEVRIASEGVEVRYGKIGTTGQSMVKPFGDTEAAHKAAGKLVAEKLRGGYKEMSGKVNAPEAQPTNPPTVESVKPTTLSKVTPAPKTKPVKPMPKAPAALTGVGIKTLCISGKLPSGLRKSDYDSALQTVGIKLVDDVTAGLDYLVLADPNSMSSKALKAKQVGARIISEDELIAITSDVKRQK